MLEVIYEPIVELGYSIQQSQIFKVSGVILVLMGCSLIYMLVRYLQINKKLRSEQPRHTKSVIRMPSIHYERIKRQQTRRAVDALMNSKQFKQYQIDKDDPYSKMNSKIFGYDSEEFSEDQSDSTKSHSR